ncbi:phosphotransferase family protein [Prauserella halophila]|uniref:Phosphotransferase family protein n=1 Tax=Prauserella halophila TaxID=185641 RepID=A0ABN1VZ19_9PSEU|nr:phosphotransferase family protein [Prauserella halophila]MCP2237445.1 putative kinase, aminoglycoside phosphotransferase (APT) family [Prauserella halophila]
MSDADPPGVDLARLRPYLDRELPGAVTGPLTARLIEGGRSNLTYIIGDGTHRWVLRRPPLGHVLPTAHDMGREHRVISGLHETAVPVPRALSLCTDDNVLGAQFYVMDFVEGSPLRTADELQPRGEERTRAIAGRLVETLVDLHAVDPHAVGLGDFGKPDGFLERQLRRWSKQLAASRSRDVPGIDELHDRLAARIPDSPAPSIVHGDYRLDNVLVDSDDRIAAVLDWEMSTLGDPLTDVALLLAYSQLHTLDLDTVSDVGAAPGHPSPEELGDAYARASGRDVSAMGWYLGFALFKLAVILEGIYYRYSHGQTVGEGFDRIGAGVAPLVARGNAALKGN